MTGAITLPRDLQERLDAYAQEHGLTERQALDKLIPRKSARQAPPKTASRTDPEELTPAEKRRADQGRRDIEKSNFMDGPAFFDSLGV